MKSKLLSFLLLPLLIFSVVACTETPSDDPDLPETPGTIVSPEPGPDAEPEPEEIEGRRVVSAEEVNSFDEAYLRLFGRTYLQAGNLVLSNVCTGAEITFYGTSASADIISGNVTLYFTVFVDGDTEGSFIPIHRNGEIVLCENLPKGVHTVRLLKATSSQNGNLTVRSFQTDGKFLAPDPMPLRIEFVGDSITAGAGVYGTSGEACTIANSDGTKGYAYRTAQSLDAVASLVAAEGICVGARGRMGVSMLDMYLQYSSIVTGQYPAEETYDIVVVALGTNDSWYMSSDPLYTQADFTDDYAELLSLIRSRNPEAYVVCVHGMMGNDDRVTRGIQTAVARADDERISICPLPEGRSGGEGHPSAEEAKTQSAVLTDYLNALLS